MSTDPSHDAFTQSVIRRHPKLFDVGLDSDDPVAMYGFEVFTGWYPIVASMIDQIDNFATQHGYSESLRIIQVKTKFCILRCTTTIQDKNLDQLIDKYAEKASRTCEKCSQPGKIRTDRKWKMVLCDVCNIIS